MAVFKLRNAIDTNNAENLSELLGVSQLTARLLIMRGYDTPQKAKPFLKPNLDGLHSPWELSDMALAVRRIERAVSKEQRIWIYGDYDVDGTTACSLMLHFFKDLDYNVEYYIPHRDTEGYGLNRNAIRQIHESGCDLIITVDCGITSHSEIELANELGVDVIITDHHKCPDVIPPAVAVINPQRPSSDGSVYPFPGLSGVGVAAKLIQAIKSEEYLLKYMDLIALGTVADLVPLTDENRIFTHMGIAKMSDDPMVGIKALIDVCAYKDNKMNSGRIAFGLAPRLNAAGRLDTARLGVELLTSDDDAAAAEIAQKLNEANIVRKQIEKDVTKEARDYVEQNIDLSRNKFLLPIGEQWHKGVIGIAASRIVEIYNRPCALVTVDGELCSASARSVNGFDLYKCLQGAEHLFTKFGGHAQAAGFSMLKENLSKLSEYLNDYCKNNLDNNLLLPAVTYDLNVKGSKVDLKLVEEIDRMAPFGMGNPKPTLLINNLTVEQADTMGENSEHLRLNLHDDVQALKAVYFRNGHLKQKLLPGSSISMISEADCNTYGGVSSLQFMVKAINVNIESMADVNKFADEFYYKFYDAFIETYRQNSNDDFTRFNDFSSVAHIDLITLLTDLKNNPMGKIILTKSQSNTKAMLKRLIDSKITDRITVGYTKLVGSAAMGMNALLVCPYHDCKLSNYNKIFIFDSELPLLKTFSELKDFMERVIIIDTGNMRSSDILNYSIGRKMLGAIYKWLSQDTWSNRVVSGYKKLHSDINAAFPDMINAFQLHMALEIFTELEFIDITKFGQAIRIKLIPNPGSRQLNDSRLFNYHSRWSAIINS